MVPTSGPDAGDHGTGWELDAAPWWPVGSTKRLVLGTSSVPRTYGFVDAEMATSLPHPRLQPIESMSFPVAWFLAQLTQSF